MFVPYSTEPFSLSLSLSLSSSLSLSLSRLIRYKDKITRLTYCFRNLLDADAISKPLRFVIIERVLYILLPWQQTLISAITRKHAFIDKLKRSAITVICKLLVRTNECSKDMHMQITCDNNASLAGTF